MAGLPAPECGGIDKAYIEKAIYIIPAKSCSTSKRKVQRSMQGCCRRLMNQLCTRQPQTFVFQLGSIVSLCSLLQKEAQYAESALILCSWGLRVIAVEVEEQQVATKDLRMNLPSNLQTIIIILTTCIAEVCFWVQHVAMNYAACPGCPAS